MTEAHLRWRLTLYVSGASVRSIAAVENLKALCARELADRVDLTIVDASDAPDIMLGNQIVALPTLIKSLPLPVRRLVGDLSDTSQVRVALDLGEEPPSHPEPRPQGTDAEHPRRHR